MPSDDSLGRDESANGCHMYEIITNTSVTNHYKICFIYLMLPTYLHLYLYNVTNLVGWKISDLPYIHFNKVRFQMWKHLIRQYIVPLYTTLPIGYLIYLGIFDSCHFTMKGNEIIHLAWFYQQVSCVIKMIVSHRLRSWG